MTSGGRGRGADVVPYANAGRKVDTVIALAIQRRTLYARLARVEQVLGHSLDSQDTLTRLTLTLQRRDILSG